MAASIEPTSLEIFLEDRRRFFIQQRLDWSEALIGFERRNRYDVFDEGAELIGRIEEDQGLLSRVLARLFLGSHRGFEIDVRDHRNRDMLSLTRPFYFFFSTLSIWDRKGRRLGQIQRRFSIFYRRYDLLDERGRFFAYIRAPIWRPWTFPIFCVGGIERARISKKWSGLLKEAFTDIDNFVVDLGEMPWTLHQRAVLFAAAVSIDFDFFENNHR